MQVNRNSLTPTKSVPVNISMGGYSKYLMWLAKILFYICVFTIVTALIPRLSKYFGVNMNYVIVVIILVYFSYNGQLSYLTSF